MRFRSGTQRVMRGTVTVTVAVIIRVTGMAGDRDSEGADRIGRGTLAVTVTGPTGPVPAARCGVHWPVRGSHWHAAQQSHLSPPGQR